MNRKNIITKEVMIIVITVIMISTSFVRVAAAKALHGCAKDEMVMMKPGVCPDGSRSSPLKEAYIPDTRDRALMDTLSASEKRRLGIRGDKSFVMVVYLSRATGEAGFLSGRDKSGNLLMRKVVDLKYTCAKESVLASQPLFADCQLIPDSGEDYDAVDPATQKNVLNLKTECTSLLRESLQKSIDESWPIFYSHHKEEGLNDKEIKEMFEETKKQFYKEYNYDPETDSFKN